MTVLKLLNRRTPQLYSCLYSFVHSFPSQLPLQQHGYDLVKIAAG